MPVNESLTEILNKQWESRPLAEILEASPAVLQGVSDRKAEALREAFGVKTVADLASLKYVRWAQAIATLAEVEKL